MLPPPLLYAPFHNFLSYFVRYNLLFQDTWFSKSSNITSSFLFISVLWFNNGASINGNSLLSQFLLRAGYLHEMSKRSIYSNPMIGSKISRSFLASNQNTKKAVKTSGGLSSLHSFEDVFYGTFLVAMFQTVH